MDQLNPDALKDRTDLIKTLVKVVNAAIRHYTLCEGPYVQAKPEGVVVGNLNELHDALKELKDEL